MTQADQAGAIWTPSPCYWPGRAGYEPTIIVVHGTAGAAPGCVTWLCDPQSGASAHYVVTRDGTVHQLVSEHNSAWANGIPEIPSPYVNGANPNLFSISIEAERPDPENTTPLTDVQVQRLISLVAGIRGRWGHLPLVPHSAISPQSRARCPGPGYPLSRIDVSSAAPPGHVTWVPFTGTPTRVPVVFYAGPSLLRPLYRSQADTRTMLAFDGWQLGERVSNAEVTDARWFHRHNPSGQMGWCPAAWISTKDLPS